MSWIALMLVLLDAARAQAWCADGTEHPYLALAVADPACGDIRVSGSLAGRVILDRDVRITGEGMEQTFLLCEDGPCVMVAPGADVVLEDLTVSSAGAAVSAFYATLTLTRVAMLPFGHRGGWLKLRETDAVLTSCAFEVREHAPPMIQAVSTVGHDLEFRHMRFLGVGRESGTQGPVYTVGYGVACTDCAYGPLGIPPQYVNPDSVTLPGDVVCLSPAEADRRSCERQCGVSPVLSCDMRWHLPTQRCVAVAACDR